MTSSELHRKLLYCGYTDITDYLKNSPVNRFIYKIILEVGKHNDIDFPVLTLINEIYYQCVKIQNDRTPGIKIKERYIDEETEWLGSENAAMLVYCLVWAVFRHKKHRTFQEDCFMDEITALIMQSRFATLPEDLMYFLADHHYTTPDVFLAMPCPIQEIPVILQKDANSYNPWKEITDNFSLKTVEWYIMLYATKEDQKSLLERIENACDEGTNDLNDKVFSRIRKGIDDELYVKRRADEKYALRIEEEYDPNKDYELLYSEGVQFSREESEAERYKRELTVLKKKYEELQEKYEKCQDESEAKYRGEIEGLKNEIAKLSEKKNHHDDYVYSKTVGVFEKELELPISEMVAYVNARFSKGGAEEFINMYYHLASKHKYINEDTSRLVDEIIPAILYRDSNHQTFEVNNPIQVNINSEVENINNKNK